MDNHIAVIGVAGRYPKSINILEFWENLRNGVDCLETFSDEELDELGIPEEKYNDPNFVRRGTRLPFADCFDAKFFNFTPKTAQAMDPQCRIFLETCYHALENAGYDPFDFDVPVGVFAGSNPNDYAALLGVADPSDSLSAFDQLIGSDKDFLATRVAHCLNLKGPALTIQTACSTSLVTIHMAVQSLLNFECDVCLAGGVTVNFRQGAGYFYQDGMILSREGKCRAFDAEASGTTLGQGCGVVTLKRLSDAIKDKDHVYAIVRSSAINNDGADKITFTAPSENGQTEVITIAHQLAEVEAESIGYVETHGTATSLGDPIEVAALTRAFSATSSGKQYCAIGSAKTNFGHTDAAAGVTGFLKTVLSLHHGEIVPSLHFNNPNPEIRFEDTPFFVNTTLRKWDADSCKRAGVSAFGIGGTNAHAVLEEAPHREHEADVSLPQLLPISAKTPEALVSLESSLKKYIQSAQASDISLGSIALTLQQGRPNLNCRGTMVVWPRESGGALYKTPPNPQGKVADTDEDLKVIWIFSGQGSQYAGMCSSLYGSEPIFSEAVDRCTEIFDRLSGADLKTIIFNATPEHSESLKQTAITQPALFTIQYGLVKMLQSWGHSPTGLIGHSIGEYAAAVVAGILSVEDAASVVHERAKLMQSMAPGSMLSINLSMEDVRRLLVNGLTIAAANSHDTCVAAGPTELIVELQSKLDKEKIEHQLLNTSHAFHSEMMTEAAIEFERFLAGIRFSKPRLPMISNITGDWITDDQATDPGFWARQIVSPVLFGKCVATSTQHPKAAYLEIGPGRTLSSLVRRNKKIDTQTTTICHMVRHADSTQVDDHTHALQAIGRLWCGGLKIDWNKQGAGDSYCRTPLPEYPFERQKHWKPGRYHQLALPLFGELDLSQINQKIRLSVDQWLYAPSWRRLPNILQHQAVNSSDNRVLLLPAWPDEKIDAFVKSVFPTGHTTVVTPGSNSALAVSSDSVYVLDPNNDTEFDALFDELANQDIQFNQVIHAWFLDHGSEIDSVTQIDSDLALGIHAAHACARGVSKLAGSSNIQLDFLTTGAQSVTGDEGMHPMASALLGPTKVIPLEYPQISCRHIDVEEDYDRILNSGELSVALACTLENRILALRGRYLWEHRVEPIESQAQFSSKLKQGGHYLIIGGLGGVGLSISEYLVDNYNAQLTLTSRSGRPQRSQDGLPVSETDLRLDLLESIEQRANRLDIVSANIADKPSMQLAIENIYGADRKIDGVIVAAGVPDQSGSIHRRTREQAVTAIESKVHGSIILCDLLKDKSLDFLLFSSSIASMLYHNRFGQVGYVTANHYVEAMAIYARQMDLPATTVAWDDWMNIGMSVRAAADFSETYGTDVDLVDKLHSFTPAEGIECFINALSCNEPVVYVSTTDLNVRIQEDVAALSPFLEQAISNDSSEQPIDMADDSVNGILRSVWSDLLGYETFNDDDDFFDLGGDSLQAARMIDRLSRTFSARIPLNTIFDYPQLTALSNRIEELLTDTTKNKEASVFVGNMPLAPAQLRFMKRKNTNQNHFNISILLKADKYIKSEILSQVLSTLVRRHESLRLKLSSDNVLSQESVSPDKINLSIDFLKVESFEKSSTMPILDDLHHSLDLWDGRVLRLAILENPQREQRVFIVVHHMVSDRISLFVLIDEINQLYQQLDGGKSPELSYKSNTYADWVNRQIQDVNSTSEYTDFWLAQNWEKIKNLPVPSACKEPQNLNSNATDYKLEVPLELSTSILRSSKGRANAIMLSALSDAIISWTKSDAALIEALGHGRRNISDVDVSGTTGFFLSYNPVIVGRSEELALDVHLKSIENSLDKGWAYDNIRFYHSDETTREAFDVFPKAQVLFNFVGREIEASGDELFQVSDEYRGTEIDPHGARDHLLSIIAIIKNEQLHITFVYSKDYHHRDEIEYLSRNVLKQLELISVQLEQGSI